MIVLGVDPGLKTTGYGIIAVPTPGGTAVRLLEAGTISPPRNTDLPDRLRRVHAHLEAIVRQHTPETLVLEKVYAHARHPATLGILGHVRGVVCLVSAQQGVRLVEYSVKRVRKSLLGNGAAGKDQTREVVAHILKVPADGLPVDASDALALALGYAHLSRY